MDKAASQMKQRSKTTVAPHLPTRFFSQLASVNWQKGVERRSNFQGRREGRITRLLTATDKVFAAFLTELQVDPPYS